MLHPVNTVQFHLALYGRLTFASRLGHTPQCAVSTLREIFSRMEIHRNQERELPDWEERRQILHWAGLVLAKARALVERLDQTEKELNWSAPETQSKGFTWIWRQ